MAYFSLMKSKYVVGLILLWVAYVVLTVLEPTQQAAFRYGVTPTELNVLKITILLPYLFIWVAALTAVLYFRNYSSLVSGALEGPGFKKITAGLWLLLIVTVLPPFISLIA